MADNITIKDATGANVTVRTSDLGGVHHQHYVRSLPGGTTAAERVVIEGNFGSAGNGATVDFSLQGMKNYSLQVKGASGVPTGWDVVGEVSNNGQQFSAVVQHASAAGDADGQMKWPAGGGQYAALYGRIRVISVTPGPASTINVSFVAMP
jgi:hypothetical protein